MIALCSQQRSNGDLRSPKSLSYYLRTTSPRCCIRSRFRCFTTPAHTTVPVLTANGTPRFGVAVPAPDEPVQCVHSPVFFRGGADPMSGGKQTTARVERGCRPCRFDAEGHTSARSHGRLQRRQCSDGSRVPLPARRSDRTSGTATTTTGNPQRAAGRGLRPGTLPWNALNLPGLAGDVRPPRNRCARR